MPVQPSHTDERRHLRDAPLGRRFARASAEPEAQRLALLNESTPPAAVRRRDRAFRSAVIAADVVAAVLVVGLSTSWLPTSHLSWTAALLPVLVPVVNAASGLYQRDPVVLNKNTLDETPTIFRAATVVTIISYLSSSLILVEPIGAKVVGFIWLTLTVCVLACRIAARAAIQALLPPERCLVVGDHSDGQRVAAKLEQAVGLKSELVAVMPLSVTGAGHDSRPDGDEFNRFADTVRLLDVDRVLIAAGEAAPQHELEAIQAAKALGVKVSVLPRILEVVGSSASYDSVDGLTVLGVPRFGIRRSSEAVKRAFDLTGALLLLVLAAPVFLAIACAARVSSPGPVFFRQRRIGRNGLAFSMLKFRSMYEDADRLKESLRGRNEQAGLFKIADDPRITPVGRWLRRTSLDELPQLLNVLRGDMSLVGPRPLVPDEDRQIQGWNRRRLHLTPGMTGPWQVLGSSRIPLEEMVTIDYLYVANWSLWNDAKILMRTIGTVFARRGR